MKLKTPKIILIFVLTIIGSHMTNLAFADSYNPNITHAADLSLEKEVEKIKTRLRKDQNLSYSLDETFFYLDQLQQFELGRFLLQKKGLDGKWIAYLISDYQGKVITSPLENWLIAKAPLVLATRERFGIFQNEIQKRLKSSMRLATLPSGTMNDLFSLDYSKVTDVELVGIDLDQESLDLAKAKSEKIANLPKSSFLQKDAWKLQEENKYDLLTSNGLNIYEPKPERIIALYKEFYKALKPGGALITSFLTPPPHIEESPWTHYNNYDLVKQRVLFGEIIQSKWQTFWTEDQAIEHLQKAGFKNISIIYDKQKMFPTLIAEKAL